MMTGTMLWKTENHHWHQFLYSIIESLSENRVLELLATLGSLCYIFYEKDIESMDDQQLSQS